MGEGQLTAVALPGEYVNMFERLFLASTRSDLSGLVIVELINVEVVESCSILWLVLMVSQVRLAELQICMLG
jgi:hypothetical protein